MTPAELISQLDRQATRLGEAVVDVDLDQPVPSCPEWVVRDLVRHIGGVHRWATLFAAGRTEPIDADLDEIVGGWPSDDRLVAWYREGHRELVAALSTAPADLAAWTFLDAPDALTMWSRRQAHETAMHRVDAELASGRVTGFEQGFAADGIDELLTKFITRPGRGPRATAPATILVQAEAESWWVSFDDQRCVTRRSGSDWDARISGSAGDLYQVMWNRLAYDAVDLEGDRSLVDLWRDTVHVRWS